MTSANLLNEELFSCVEPRTERREAKAAPAPKIGHSKERDMYVAMKMLMLGGDYRAKAVESVLSAWFLPVEIKEHPELRQAVEKIADKVYK